jgi:catechol 2,3-dioxygenase-like lactoylglutathione lyase family enzyme
MIDHLGLRVSDLGISSAFYARALAPLGYRVLMDHDFGVGLGVDGKPDLWLYPGAVPVDPVHVALAATDRAAVDAFHQAALAAGAIEVVKCRV